MAKKFYKQLCGNKILIEICSTVDYKLIGDIVCKPGYKEWLINDDCAAIEDILARPGMIYYLYKIDDVIAGFGAIRNIDENISIVDIAILENFRGKIGKELALSSIEKFSNESSCKILITRIDRKNKRSLYFTKWLGFKKYLDDENYIYLRLNLWADQ